MVQATIAGDLSEAIRFSSGARKLFPNSLQPPTGRSFRAACEFLLKCRILYAASLLTEPGMSVKEVAFRCHFDDVSSFSRLFRKKMGVSPSAYLRVITM